MQTPKTKCYLIRWVSGDVSRWISGRMIGAHLGRAAESEAGAPGQLMDTGPLLDTCTEHNFQNLKIVVDLFVGC